MGKAKAVWAGNNLACRKAVVARRLLFIFEKKYQVAPDPSRLLAYDLSLADVLEALETACDEAPLVLLGSDLASRIPSRQLDALLSRTAPAVVVVPDVRGQAPLPDMAQRLRKQLGVLE